MGKIYREVKDNGRVLLHDYNGAEIEDDGLVECEECGAFVPEGTMTIHQGRYLCEDCVFRGMLYGTSRIWNYY